MKTRKSHHFSWEYFMFLFTRLSGVCIILFALIGSIAALVMGARTQMDLSTLMRWTFFPNSFHVVTSVPDIQNGWTSNLWRMLQMLIVLLGLTHGFNGLRVVLDDFLKKREWQFAVRILLFFVWLFLLWAAYELIQIA